MYAMVIRGTYRDDVVGPFTDESTCLKACATWNIEHPDPENRAYITSLVHPSELSRFSSAVKS